MSEAKRSPQGTSLIHRYIYIYIYIEREREKVGDQIIIRYIFETVFD